MMVFLGWLQLVLVIAAAGILAGTLLSGVAANRWLGRLMFMAPRPRLAVLSALALLPLALGAFGVAIVFAPSLLDVLGLVADHCSHHDGHAFHLCFVHGHPPQASPLVLGGGVALLLWLGAAFGDEVARLRRASDWTQRFTALARYDDEIGGWTLATQRPFAAAIGLLRPKVCVSECLRDLLSADQFQAVIAHEREHARRRDSLIKFAIRLAVRFHLPWVRERLLEEFDLACEQACDEAAAEVVEDRLTVAEAILAVERANVSREMPGTALGFGTHALERRVQSMLDANWKRPTWTAISTSLAATVVSVVIFYDLAHHGVETLLSLVF